MAGAYITGPDVKSFLGVTVTGSESQLQASADAANSWLESYCRRSFTLADTATARVFDVSHDGSVRTTDIGSSDDLAVASDDSSSGSFSTWDVADYQLEPLNALDDGRPVTAFSGVGVRCFPRRCRRQGLIRVTAKWGWPSVPADVLLGVTIQAAHLFKRKDSAEGVLGTNDFGVVRVGRSVDPDAAELINPYRRPLGFA